MAQTPSTLQHVCPAVLTSLESIVGNKRRMEHATGLLDAILDDPNYLAFEGEFSNPFIDATTGHFREVRMWWDNRLTPSSVSTSYGTICDIPSITRTRPEEVVTITQKAGITIERTEAVIRQLCSEFSQLDSIRGFKSRGDFPLPPVMNRLGRDMWAGISVVRKQINDNIRALLNAQAGTFVFAGPTPSPSPLPLNLTTTSADAIRSGAIVRMFREFTKAEYDGEIIVVSDLNAMYDAKILLGASCCNLQGIDNKVLAGDRIYYYADKGFNTGFQPGTNQFLAWIPGSIRLVHQNEFISDNGILGLAYGGNYWQTVIPDPVFGDRLMFDIRIAHDGCGAWTISVQSIYDIVIRPNMYDPGDDLFGVRDVFVFDANTADPCVQVCP